MQKSREMGDSLIHHLNDLKNYEGLSSEEGLTREKKVMGKNMLEKGQKEVEKKIVEIVEKAENKDENRINQSPPKNYNNIKIVSTTNIKIDFQ